MQLRAFILVACLTTVPAVAAEGPVPFCEQDGTSLRCEVGVPSGPADPIHPEGCKPVVLEIDAFRILPADPHVYPECVLP